jgi:anti-sigma factor RsiW
MSCERTQNLLFDYVDGSLDAAGREHVVSHLESCTVCAALVASLEQESADEDLTRAVLSRTSKNGCEQSGERLPDWIDGSLDAFDAELVSGHVAHCEECAALAAVMRTMSADLPALAEVETDGSFTDDVLAATSARLPAWVEPTLAAFAEVEPDERFLDDVMAATAHRQSPAVRWAARVEAWFGTLVQRPRIAWEGAYVMSVVLVLLVSFPGSPLAAMPQKALELVQTDPNKIEQPFVELEAGINTAASEAWFTTRKVTRTLVVKASVSSGDVYRKAKRDLGTLWDSIASDTENEREQTQEEASTNGESK